MQIGVYARQLDIDENVDFLNLFFNKLLNEKVEVFVHRNMYEDLEKLHCYSVLKVFDTGDDRSKNFDFVFSLGGDGTMLDTLSIVRDYDIPVLGINLGRFGFLANSQKEDFEENFELLKQNAFSVEKRSVLKLESKGDYFEGFPYALNDLIIHKNDTSSMITVHVKLNGEILNTYWADGLIVASPTGSSGYSLSCGGPLLFPGCNSLVITPIAPHNLTVRPIVIDDKSSLSFEIETRTDEFLITLDNRSVSIKKHERLVLTKADFRFNMVRLNNQSFLQNIRNKLMWGFDKRN
ncbi:MAG: NAD kinase [Flavobacteriales bacterium]|nr:NAD kinase [Flavobacteriales bacterium]